MEVYKSVIDSRTEHIQIVFAEHINGIGRLFGGKLVEWMDVVAAVVARRHSGSEVTTVSIEKLDFKEAARLNDTILIIGEMVSVGNSSMKVKISAYVEKLSGEKLLINTADFVMVAIGGTEEKPRRVPRLLN